MTPCRLVYRFFRKVDSDLLSSERHILYHLNVDTYRTEGLVSRVITDLDLSFGLYLRHVTNKRRQIIFNAALKSDTASGLTCTICTIFEK